MKKFKFTPSDLGEVLTREELKMVYGGSYSKKDSSSPCSGSKGCSYKSEGADCYYLIDGNKYEGYCKWIPGTYPHLLCWGGNSRTPCK